MAITTTELLGTDSISGSRIVINDNFAILRDEINALETYIDPDAGTIDGINSLETIELRVGQAGSYVLEITASDFNISTDVSFSGTLNLNGLVTNESFAVIDEAAFSGLATIDPQSGFAAYTIIHATTGDFTVELQEGLPGQEVKFFVEQKGGGQVLLQAEGSTVFVLDSSNTKVSLDDIGASVTLKYVIDSSSNGSWFVVSGHNYSLLA